MQNMKTDIVYYMGNTDFEMEFNLCGCCRMRLLTDKAENQKELISALARAVSRSRVILVCGPVFGETGLMKTISTALNAKAEIIDNSKFGIAGDEKIEVIAGAVPLVTADGIFGGCIIESGPQSIIILSENRNVRKSLMNGLVHQYIEELSMVPTGNEGAVLHETPAVNTNRQQEEISEDLNEPQAENQPEESLTDNVISDEPSVPETAEPEKSNTDEHNIEFVDKEGKPLSNNADTGFLHTPENPDHTHYSDYYVPSESDKLFSVGEKPNEKRSEGSDKKLTLPIILVLLFLVCIVLAIAYFLIGIPLIKGEPVSSYVSKIFEIGSSSRV